MGIFVILVVRDSASPNRNYNDSYDMELENTRPATDTLYHDMELENKRPAAAAAPARIPPCRPRFRGCRPRWGADWALFAGGLVSGFWVGFFVLTIRFPSISSFTFAHALIWCKATLTNLDLFGPVWIYVDAFGCIWMRSDAFGHFRKIFNFLARTRPPPALPPCLAPGLGLVQAFH